MNTEVHWYAAISPLFGRYLCDASKADFLSPFHITFLQSKMIGSLHDLSLKSNSRWISENEIVAMFQPSYNMTKWVGVKKKKKKKWVRFISGTRSLIKKSRNAATTTFGHQWLASFLRTSQFCFFSFFPWWFDVEENLLILTRFQIWKITRMSREIMRTG